MSHSISRYKKCFSLLSIRKRSYTVALILIQFFGSAAQVKKATGRGSEQLRDMAYEVAYTNSLPQMRGGAREANTRWLDLGQSGSSIL